MTLLEVSVFTAAVSLLILVMVVADYLQDR